MTGANIASCPQRWAWRALGALSAALLMAISQPALGEKDGGAAREAGPEDGILCCLGLPPFIFNGDEVLASTGRAGVFRSEHRGARWQRSMDGLVAPDGVSPFVDFLCQAPSQPRTVYALAGFGLGFSSFNGVFSSDDFGRTWTRRLPLNVSLFASCAVDADDSRTLYIATTDANFTGELWRSTDGGRTVERIGAELPPTFGAPYLRAVRGTLYSVLVEQGWFASTDRGATFHFLAAPKDFPGALDASPDGRAIFVNTTDSPFPDSNVTGTFRSADGGKTFTAVTGLPDGMRIPLAFDPTDSSRIYENDDLLRVSTDDGLTFALLPASNDPRFLGPVRETSVDPRGSVYVDTLAGPFRSDDGGQTFEQLLDGYRAAAVQDLAFDADGRLLVGVLHTQTVFRQTRDGNFRAIGNTPLIEVDGSSNDAQSLAGSPTDANVVLVATNGQGLFRTDDGGMSWTVVEVTGAPALYTNSRMIFPSGSRVYLVVPSTLTPGLYRSDDAGKTFERLSSSRFGAVAADPNNADVLYAGTFFGSEGLFKSIDGGHTLQRLDQPGTFSALAVDRRHPEVIYAGEKFGQVIRSLDGGKSFAPASTGLAGAGVHGLAQDAHGTLYAWLRGGGLFASRDNASTWHPIDTGEALHRSGVEAGRGALVVDPRHPGRVYLGNAGVIRIDDEEN